MMRCAMHEAFAHFEVWRWKTAPPLIYCRCANAAASNIAARAAMLGIDRAANAPHSRSRPHGLVAVELEEEEPAPAPSLPPVPVELEDEDS